MRLPATALALTTGLWAGSVRAAPVEALLLPVEARGVPVQKAERVDRSLGDYAVGIRQPIEADRRKAPRYGCRDDASCWVEVGKQLQVKRLIGSTLIPAGSNAYTLTIMLIDITTGNILARGDRKIAGSALGSAPRKLLADVLWQAPADGAAANRTTPPYPVIEQPAVVATRGSRAYLRPLKWAAAGGAVGAIIVGAALLGVDGTSTCAKAPGQRQCPDVYDTVGGGASLVVIVAALAATAAVLFVIDRRTGERKSWTGVVVPGPAGVMAAVGGRF